MQRPPVALVSIVLATALAALSLAPAHLGAPAAGGRSILGGPAASQNPVGGLNVPLVPASSPLSTLTFSESGLASGLRWNVSLAYPSLDNGSNVSTGTSGTIGLSVSVNTTYSYSVQSVVPDGSFAYATGSSSGTIYVPAGGATVYLVYQALPASSVQFNETGLPNKVTWNVSVSGSFGSPGAIPVGAYPESLALDTATGELFVVNSNSNNVSVVDPANNSVVASIPVGSLPRGIAYDPANGNLYVANLLSNNLSVINGATHSVVGSVPTGTSPVRVVFDPTNGYLYVTNHNSSNVSVINAATNLVVRSVPTGLGPVDIALDSANGYLYVANRVSNNVSVINGATNRVVGSVPAGVDPRFLTFDPLNGYVYVSNYDSGNLTIVNGATDTVVGSIPVGYAAHEGSVDPVNGYLYLSQNTQPGTVTVVDTFSNTVVGSISVGSYPAGNLYDPSNGRLYVTDEFSDAVTVLNLSVGEGGVAPAPGTGFGTTVNGTGTIQIDLFSGTYTFSIEPVVRQGVVYLPSPANGTLSVNGTPISIAVAFSTGALYNVTFKETGLPTGTSWIGTSGPVGATFVNTVVRRAGTLTFQETAGLAAFRFAAGGFGVARVTGPGSPTLHTAQIAGPQAFVVHFGTLESVNFTEVVTTARPGLPVHSSWSVVITQKFSDGSSQVVASATTNSTYAEFALPSGGHYSYQIVKPQAYRAWGGHGAFTVPAHAMNKRVEFAPYASRLVFIETGLAPGTLWGVTVNGTAALFLEGTAAALSVKVLNGSYTYAFSAVGALSPSPIGGNLTIVAPLTRKVLVTY